LSRPSTLVWSPPTPPCPSPATSARPYRRDYPTGDRAGRHGGLPSYLPWLSLHATPDTPGSRRRALSFYPPPWQPSPEEKRLGAPGALLSEGSDVTTLRLGSLALRPAGSRRLPKSLRRAASERVVALSPRAPRYRAERATARTGLSPVSHGPSSAHSPSHGSPTPFTVRHAQLRAPSRSGDRPQWTPAKGGQTGRPSGGRGAHA
jgi:hypothetical protein